MASELRSQGVEIVLGAPLLGTRPEASGLAVRTPTGTFSARYLVNCAGLYSDRVTLGTDILFKPGEAKSRK